MKKFLLCIPIAISISSFTLSAQALPLDSAAIGSNKPTMKFDDRMLNPQPLPPKDSNLNIRKIYPQLLPSQNSNMDIRQLNPQPLPPKASTNFIQNKAR